MPGLSAVTLTELADLVRERVNNSYAATATNRRLLLDLIEQMRGDDAAQAEPCLLDDATGWRLLRVEVQGFAGIDNRDTPFVLDLEPCAGLTVIQGNNGTGKTSLANAIRAVLRNAPGDTVIPVKDDLWWAHPVSDAGSGATVMVTLVRTGCTLTLTGRFPRNGEASVRGEFSGPSGQRTVTLDKAWEEALTSSSACFDYARLQGRLRTDNDLQLYLMELLLLGPVWAEVREQLKQRTDAAETARTKLENLKRKSKQAERACTQRFLTDLRRPDPLPEITWPGSWKDDVDDWLRSNDLAHHQQPLRLAVNPNHEPRLQDLADDLERARAEFGSVGSASGRGDLVIVLHVLKELHSAADLEPSACPVCGTTTDWHATLDVTLRELEASSAKAKAVSTSLKQLYDWVQEELGPLLKAGLPGGPADEAQKFQDAVRDGCHPGNAADHAATRLVAACRRPEYSEWVERLRASSDAAAEWNAQRTSLVNDLVDAWRAQGSLAAEAEDWKVAQDTLNKLQLEFRTDRQEMLTPLLEQAVTQLLPDAEIEIQKITHTGGVYQLRGAQVDLLMAGKPATLGMLSSGQRNALLMASLVCVDNAAPFGFLLIDDPVHALDDFRVDRLASRLADMAQRRQVVVLTHDTRLTELLLARVPEMRMRQITREPGTATVAASSGKPPWERMLEEASQTVDASSEKKDQWTIDAPLPTVVGGLCRHAVDGALRHVVISAAASTDKDVTAALARLDALQGGTATRIAHVLSRVDGELYLPRTVRIRDHHLELWNRATHGQLGNEPFNCVDEIKAARKACKELAGWRP